MDLQRLLQINMATLAALATVLLGMGQNSTAQPLAVCLAAAASLWLTDVKGWIRLGRTATTVVVLPVMVYFAFRLLRVGGENRLLELANLVVCLQVILFFQQKNIAIYWQLAMVSLLQVVVAAGFSHGVAFGLLLVIYMLTGLSALALLFLYSQWSRYEQGADSGAGTVPTSASAKMGLSPSRGTGAELPAAPGRWPLAAAESAFSDAAAGSSHAGLVGELLRRLAMVGAGTLVLATVIFLAVPRLAGSAFRGAMFGPPKSVIGFSDTVELGQLGEVLESREEVMRVKLSQPALHGGNPRPYPVQPDIYLRGAILTCYGNGKWNHCPGKALKQPISPPAAGADAADGDAADAANEEAVPPPQTSGVPPSNCIWQQITVEPLDRNELFCIWPLLLDDSQQGKVFFERVQRRLMRRADLQEERFAYRCAPRRSTTDS